MKVQEVLMQAISGKLTWLEAEDILGWQPRTLRRWRLRYQQRGYDGLWDRRRHQPSPRRAPVAEVARITRLYQKQYTGFNAAHFHEFAQRDHGVTLGYTFVKRLLQTAGLLPKRRPRGRHRRRREPRPCFGELLHIDGSPHPWLALRPAERQTLIPIIDDATKRVLYAQLVAAESTATIMAALWSVLVTHGLPQALYTDRASWAFYTPKAGEPVAKDVLTQVGRALARLGIEHIPAYSPEARGRSERLNRTFQERLVNELRLAGITTVPAANRYLHERFLATYDARFTHAPADPASAFVPLGTVDLTHILCHEETRTVAPDNTVSLEGVRLQIDKQPGRRTCEKLHVLVRRHLDGGHCVWYGTRCFGHYDAIGRRVPAAAPALPPFSPAVPLPNPLPASSTSILSPLRPRARPSPPAKSRRARARASRPAPVAPAAPPPIPLPVSPASRLSPLRPRVSTKPPTKPRRRARVPA
jgi:transposase